MKKRREDLKNDPAYIKRDAARKIISEMVRGKFLIRQPCEVCGAEKSEAHHDDYEKPLEVRWLCRKHHREHHAKD